jgi:hypothetical protein
LWASRNKVLKEYLDSRERKQMETENYIIKISTIFTTSLILKAQLNQEGKVG